MCSSNLCWYNQPEATFAIDEFPRDADCVSVTTKLATLKKGRSRKTSQGCTEAPTGMALYESLNFLPEFTKSN